MELKFEDVFFYAALDEKAFFDWLGAIGCVREIFGRGNQIVAFIEQSKIDEESVRSLIALRHRYHVDMTQLQGMANPFAWAKARDAYFYKSLWGDTSENTEA